MTIPDTHLGHNGGPELEPEDDDPTGRLLFVKWAWTRAHDEAWKTPPLDILRFRVARAEAAGLTYREYMLQLLDTGRYPQASDSCASAKPKRPLAKPGPPMHRQPPAPGAAPKLAAPKLPAPKLPAPKLPATSGRTTMLPPVTIAAIADNVGDHRLQRSRALPTPQPGPPPTLLKVHK
jgi:hypothetical protein